MVLDTKGKLTSSNTSLDMVQLWNWYVEWVFFRMVKIVLMIFETIL